MDVNPIVLTTDATGHGRSHLSALGGVVDGLGYVPDLGAASIHFMNNVAAANSMNHMDVDFGPLSTNNNIPASQITSQQISTSSTFQTNGIVGGQAGQLQPLHSGNLQPTPSALVPPPPASAPSNLPDDYLFHDYHLMSLYGAFLHEFHIPTNERCVFSTCTYSIPEHLHKSESPPGEYGSQGDMLKIFWAIREAGGYNNVSHWSHTVRRMGYRNDSSGHGNIIFRFRAWAIAHHVAEFCDFLLGLWTGEPYVSTAPSLNARSRKRTTASPANAPPDESIKDTKVKASSPFTPSHAPLSTASSMTNIPAPTHLLSSPLGSLHSSDSPSIPPVKRGGRWSEAAGIDILPPLPSGVTPDLIEEQASMDNFIHFLTLEHARAMGLGRVQQGGQRAYIDKYVGLFNSPFYGKPLEIKSLMRALAEIGLENWNRFARELGYDTIRSHSVGSDLKKKFGRCFVLEYYQWLVNTINEKNGGTSAGNAAPTTSVTSPIQGSMSARNGSEELKFDIVGLSPAHAAPPEPVYQFRATDADQHSRFIGPQ